MTQFTIEADVRCSDGPCGKVSRLVVEPGTQAVTHLVVTPGHRAGPGRLVPVDLVEATAGEIKLRCSRAEFAQLDPAEETDLLPGGSGYPVYHPDLDAMGTHVSGLTMSSLSIGDGARVVTHDTVPAGEVDVRRGEPVYATDGEIGRIQGLVIDPGSQHVTHVLLEEGHLWGRKEVAIPISAVTRVGELIRLNIGKQQVQDLPPVDVDHPAL